MTAGESMPDSSAVLHSSLAPTDRRQHQNWLRCASDQSDRGTNSTATIGTSQSVHSHWSPKGNVGSGNLE